MIVNWIYEAKNLLSL